jgi:hypothetical protein
MPERACRLRPKFSNSSILGFFIGEILIHAVSQINAPSYAARLETAARTRTIKRIVISCPAASSREERALLLQRGEDAVDLIWRASGWTSVSADSNAITRGLGAPPRPVVILGLDIDLASQFIYLFDEIRGRFGGDAAEFVELARRQRPSRQTTPALRIASIDASPERTHHAVVGYDLDRDAALTPTLEHAGQNGVGTDTMIAAIAERHVVKAIADALGASGLADPHTFLTDALGPWHAASIVEDPHFAARMYRKVLLPAAKAVVAWYGAAAQGQHAGISHVRLDQLVALTDRDLTSFVETLTAAAARARTGPEIGPKTGPEIAPEIVPEIVWGRDQFRLENVVVTLRRHDIETSIQTIISPLLDALGADIERRECDLVLLNGPLSALPIFERGLRQRLGMAPWRIVNMHQKSYALLNAPRSAGPIASGSHSRTWLTGSVGAWIASRGQVGDERFSLVTGQMADQMSGGRDAIAPPLRQDATTGYVRRLGSSVAAGVQPASAPGLEPGWEVGASLRRTSGAP